MNGDTKSESGYNRGEIELETLKTYNNINGNIKSNTGSMLSKIDDMDDEKIKLVNRESTNNINGDRKCDCDCKCECNKKCFEDCLLKSMETVQYIWYSIFPIYINVDDTNKTIISDMKYSRLTYAYQFIFVYSFSILIGTNLLALTILIPNLLVYSVINIDSNILRYSFGEWALTLR